MSYCLHAYLLSQYITGIFSLHFNHFPSTEICDTIYRVTKYLMEFFHIPEKVQRIITAYYGCFKMRFTTKSYTTNWQDLMIGAPVGCTVSPVMFILAQTVGAGMQIAPIARSYHQYEPSWMIAPC